MELDGRFLGHLVANLWVGKIGRRCRIRHDGQSQSAHNSWSFSIARRRMSYSNLRQSNGKGREAEDHAMILDLLNTRNVLA